MGSSPNTHVLYHATNGYLESSDLRKGTVAYTDVVGQALKDTKSNAIAKANRLEARGHGKFELLSNEEATSREKVKAELKKEAKLRGSPVVAAVVTKSPPIPSLPTVALYAPPAVAEVREDPIVMSPSFEKDLFQQTLDRELSGVPVKNGIITTPITAKAGTKTLYYLKCNGLYIVEPQDMSPQIICLSPTPYKIPVHFDIDLARRSKSAYEQRFGMPVKIVTVTEED